MKGGGISNLKLARKVGRLAPGPLQTSLVPGADELLLRLHSDGTAEASIAALSRTRLQVCLRQHQPRDQVESQGCQCNCDRAAPTVAEHAACAQTETIQQCRHNSRVV